MDIVQLSDPYLSLVAGGIAGALSRTTVSPMERVKVLFQVQGSSGKQAYNRGTLTTIWHIWKDEGIKGLFRGNGVNCVRIVPYTAIQYTVYHNLKHFITKDERDFSGIEKLLCGLTGGVLSVAGTYPLDLVKTRLSVLTAKGLHLKSEGAVDLSLWGNLKLIYKTEGGIAALYRGFIPTSMGVAPYVALNFAIFEQMKESLPVSLQSHQLSILTIGGISGGIAQTMVYPFDILRRRFQVATMGNGQLGFKYNGVLDALITIVKKEGYGGLYKGWTANMWKIIPSMAVQWWSYEQLRNILGK